MVTFANAAEKLGKSAGKYEDMLKSPHVADRNTADRMLSRINSVMDVMQGEQLAISGPPEQNSEMPEMGWGGNVREDVRRTWKNNVGVPVKRLWNKTVGGGLDGSMRRYKKRLIKEGMGRDVNDEPQVRPPIAPETGAGLLNTGATGAPAREEITPMTPMATKQLENMNIPELAAEGQDMVVEKKGGGFKNSMKNWAGENGDLLGNLGTTLLDVGIRQAAIGSMKGPKNPAYSPYANFNQNKIDITDQINSIDRDHLIRKRTIDQNLRGNNEIASHKAFAFGQTINAKNRVYQMANNENERIRRTKLYTDHKTDLFNTQITNQHNSEVTDFNNNKAVAKANNVSSGITNFRLGQNDLFQNKLDETRLAFSAKQFEESGVWDRMMSDPAIAARMKEMFPNMFK